MSMVDTDTVHLPGQDHWPALPRALNLEVLLEIIAQKNSDGSSEYMC